MTIKYVSFLYPFVRRGSGPLFKWVMLYQMSKFQPGNIVFLGDHAYFSEDDIPFETELEVSGFLFRTPSRERFRSFEKIELKVDFGPLESASRGMLDVFRKLLTETYGPLQSEIGRELSALARANDDSLCLLTWANCASLRAAATSVGVPVIHNELGPLRPPVFKGSVYFDFEGVNGQTSAQAEYLRFLAEAADGSIPLKPASEILAALEAAPIFMPEPDANSRIGVALQVEDDSNTLAFNYGWSTAELLSYARDRFGKDHLLIRPHPQARLKIASEEYGDVDASPDSITFIARCRQVLTINSSVGVEAVLLGRSAVWLGDTAATILSPVDHAPAGAADDMVHRLNYYFLAYLVPSTFLFDSGYYEWRLTRPSFKDLVALHWRELGTLQRSSQSTVAADPPISDDSAANSARPRLAHWLHSRGVTSQIESLKQGVKWLSEQRDAWREIAEEQAARIRQLDSTVTELLTGNTWLLEQRDAWQKLAEGRTPTEASPHDPPEKTREAVTSLAHQMEAFQRVNAEQEARARDFSKALADASEGTEWLAAQLADYGNDPVHSISQAREAIVRLREVLERFCDASASNLNLSNEETAGLYLTHVESLSLQFTELQAIVASLDQQIEACVAAARETLLLLSEFHETINVARMASEKLPDAFAHRPLHLQQLAAALEQIKNGSACRLAATISKDHRRRSD